MTRHRRHPWFWLALAALVSGCGGGEEAPDDGIIRLDFWHAMGGKLLVPLEDLVARFNETHPGIHIKAVNQGNYTALSQKLIASVAAGRPPDLAQAYESWTTQLVRNQAIIPLSPWMADPETGFDDASLADIYPVFIEGNTWDGEVWSFPFNKSVQALYYNGDVFETEGLAPPRNWDEWADVASRLVIDEDGDGRPERYGTAGNVSARTFCTLVFQNGGSILSADGRSIAYTSPEAFEALDFYRWLVGTDHSPVGYLSAGFEHQNDFLAGKVGMILETSVSLVFMEGKANFPLRLAPVPRGKEGGNVIAGTNVVIFDSSDDARHRAAWTFIRWFTETEQTAEWAARTGYCPVRESAMDTPILAARFESHPTLRPIFEQIPEGRLEPNATAWVEGRPWLEEEALEAVLRGLGDARVLLPAVAARTDALLAAE